MFYEINFPEGIAIKSISSINYNVNIITNKAGKEQRILSREQGQLNFKINTTSKNQNEINELICFFRNVKGNLYGFRFKDFLDYKVINQIIGIGDGVNNNFQLIKSYNINSEININRKILKPKFATVKIFINNIEINSGFEINYTNGQIIFIKPPLNNEVISTNFEFDTPVRFKNKELEISILSNNLREIKNLELIEII